ncbi:MAG: AbrB/MazE/SpoVT family DNA-binding domain-containing protein [Clostridia bacterium]|nr:AbrB/MazE/SpoVT family DNA-binding domain-containing protein [Clostridia bacterium]
MKGKVTENKFIIPVRVGPKGQITIPVVCRKMFSINEGDTLFFLGDKDRGIALMKNDELYKNLGGVFDVCDKNCRPD